MTDRKGSSCDSSYIFTNISKTMLGPCGLRECREDWRGPRLIPRSVQGTSCTDSLMLLRDMKNVKTTLNSDGELVYLGRLHIGIDTRTELDLRHTPGMHAVSVASRTVMK